MSERVALLSTFDLDLRSGLYSKLGISNMRILGAEYATAGRGSGDAAIKNTTARGSVGKILSLPTTSTSSGHCVAAGSDWDPCPRLHSDPLSRCLVKNSHDFLSAFCVTKPYDGSATRRCYGTKGTCA